MTADRIRPHPYTKKWKQTRGKAKIAVLLERDGHNCWLCGEPFSKRPGRKPSLDHVVPRSKGGGDGINNLKLAHSSCNNARGNGPPPAGARP